jgi:hypothetical protein
MASLRFTGAIILFGVSAMTSGFGPVRAPTFYPTTPMETMNLKRIINGISTLGPLIQPVRYRSYRAR